MKKMVTISKELNRFLKHMQITTPVERADLIKLCSVASAPSTQILEMLFVLPVLVKDKDLKNGIRDCISSCGIVTFYDDKCIKGSDAARKQLRLDSNSDSHLEESLMNVILQLQFALCVGRNEAARKMFDLDDMDLEVDAADDDDKKFFERLSKRVDIVELKKQISILESKRKVTMTVGEGVFVFGEELSFTLCPVDSVQSIINYEPDINDRMRKCKDKLMKFLNRQQNHGPHRDKEEEITRFK